MIIKKDVFCIKCNNKTKKVDFVEVTYSQIIDEKNRLTIQEDKVSLLLKKKYIYSRT